MNPDIPKISVETVLLAKIDFADTAYSISPVPVEEVSDELCQSIARTGLLSPPVLTCSRKIVAGWKRLRAAEKLNLGHCPCTILPPDIPEPDILTITLEETIRSRRTTAAEQAIFFKKILAFMDKQQAADRFLPLMGYSPHPPLIDRLLKLLDLEDLLLNSLHQGILDESTAREMLQIPFRDRMALFELIEMLQLSTGKQKKLITVARELAGRHRKSITDLLADREIQRILNRTEDNMPQMAANLMKLLDRLRFPQLSEARQEFRKFAGSLDLPAQVTLDHSPAFEKDTVTLTITFPDRESLVRAWQRIKPIVT